MEETKKCGPESQTSRTGSGDPQRFISADRLEAAACRLWDLCEEYSKLAKLDRDSSSNQKLISVVREM